jgi:WXG100 family type VII secretion target
MRTYDYAALDECNRAIRTGVDEMQQGAADLRKEVEGLVEQAWGGDASTGYQESSLALDKEIDGRQKTLLEMGESFKRGTQNMQDTDSEGGRRMRA